MDWIRLGARDLHRLIPENDSVRRQLRTAESYTQPAVASTVYAFKSKPFFVVVWILLLPGADLPPSVAPLWRPGP